jgi:hypothetical protein
VTGPDANPVEIPKKTWVEERRADVKKEFEGLSEGEQRRFAEAGAELLKAAKLLSPSVIRSMNSGDWKKGVILAKAVEAYGIEKYGVNWLFEA